MFYGLWKYKGLKVFFFHQIISVCDKPHDITNGYIDISTDGKKATYTCAVGFTLNGSIERVCGSNGSGWSDIDPSCGKHR